MIKYQTQAADFINLLGLLIFIGTAVIYFA